MDHLGSVRCMVMGVVVEGSQDTSGCQKCFSIWCICIWSLVAQMAKNLPAVQETQVQFLGQEDPLEEEMATHSSILAWRIPWTKEPGRLQGRFMGLQRVEHK